jgi:phosphate butyryltransferase
MDMIVNESAVRTFEEARRRAGQGTLKRVGIVAAEDEVALKAAAGALRAHIAQPVLIGDEARIRACAEQHGLHDLLAGAPLVAAENPAETAVLMARAGELDALLKGHLRTDQLLRPVLDKEKGLRTRRLLSDIAFFEHTQEGQTRLVGITDGGLNPAPTLEQKKQIAWNAIEAFEKLCVSKPKIAVMSATEFVSDGIVSTTDAAKLTAMCEAGEFGDAEVFGPLALDNALLAWAAKAKGIHHPVAGHADCLLVPTIESGNLLGKSITFIAGMQFGHVIVGARIPILIPSRVETAQDKVNAIALGVLCARC